MILRIYLKESEFFSNQDNPDYEVLFPPIYRFVFFPEAGFGLKNPAGIVMAKPHPHGEV
jgi:hypothetical protein